MILFLRDRFTFDRKHIFQPGTGRGTVARLGRAVTLSYGSESLDQHKHFDKGSLTKPLNAGFVYPSLGITRVYEHLAETRMPAGPTRSAEAVSYTGSVKTS